MPNVIKSTAVLEDNENFVVNLPEEMFPCKQEQIPSDDDLDFYINIKIENDDDELEYKKYFFVKEDEQEEQPDEYVDLNLQKAPEPPTQEEILQEKINQANHKADNIIELATKQAQKIQEQIDKQLALAEEKINQAKIITDNTIEKANKTAENIVSQAHQKANEILAQAKDEGFKEGEKEGREIGQKEGFESGHKEGKELGFNEGQKQGLSQGQEVGKQEGLQEIKNQMAEQIEQATQKAKGILIQAELDYKQKLDSMSEQVVNLAMSVASRVLNKQINENPFLILQMVKEAAKKVIEQPRLFINVNEQNYDIVFASCGEIKKELGSKQEISVVVDNSLGLADVVITTGGSGDVDARLETQMNQVRKAIEAVIT